MNIDSAIRFFSAFLNSSWDSVIPTLSGRSYTSDEDSVNDWLQANWELLIEKKVLPFNKKLNVYGSGADYNSPSSRIVDITAHPTFKVILKAKSKSNIHDLLNEELADPTNLVFDELVSFSAGFYAIAPPFNYLLAHDETSDLQRVFSIDCVEFILAPIAGAHVPRVL